MAKYRLKSFSNNHFSPVVEIIVSLRQKFPVGNYFFFDGRQGRPVWRLVIVAAGRTAKLAGQ
ncbi:MAG: hypothetical protein JSS81_18300 [Acidobacteria bacterium]|nr:hypothetical protein [Acidobacteriota bacterium]